LVYSGPMGVKNQTITKGMNMPPTFLAVGDEDKNKDQILLANYYLALKAAGVPAELHIYAKTDHGFGFRDRDAGKPSHEFMQQFYDFLVSEKLLDRKKASVN
jgi:acetyl esterase/lipase